MIKENIKTDIEKNLNKEFKEYNEEIKQRLINTSLKSLNKNINQLKLAMEEKNKSEILFFIHTIKGIFLNTRCFDLAQDFDDKKLEPLSIEEIISKSEKLLNKILK